MASKKKKKNAERITDEFGDMREPFVTNKEYMENNIIEMVYDRNAKNKKIKNFLVKTLVVGTSCLLVLGISAGPLSLMKTGALNDRVTSLQSPAFKTRYDALGADIIYNYYAQNKPNVNLLTTASWSGTSTAGGIDSGSNNSVLQNPNDTNSGSRGSAGNISAQSTNSKPVAVTNLSFIKGEQVPFVLSKDDKNTIESNENKENPFVNPVQENLSYLGYLNGKVYVFNISIAIPDIKDPTKLPYLINSPTMTVYDGSETLPLKTGTVPPDDPMYVNVTDKVGETVLEAIDNWASAYVEDERDDLKRITGDKDPKSYYKGIGGFSLVGRVSLVWAYHIFPDGKEIEDPFTVMRVSFQMKSKEDIQSLQLDSHRSDSNSSFAPVQTMDILMSGTASGIPSVVAWTSAGNWKELSSYMNAESTDNLSNTQPTTSGRTSTTKNTNSPSSSTSGTKTSESLSTSSGETMNSGLHSTSSGSSRSSNKSSESKSNKPVELHRGAHRDEDNEPSPPAPLAVHP